jgi:outer membrane lipoprotein SlyB
VRDGIARTKVKCAGCGVIESIRKIEVDERMAGRCAITDFDGTRWPGILVEGPQKDVMTLADTVAGAIGGDDRAKKQRRITGYQIVVRFRDGTRHVFTETTPRSLRLGDKVLVVGPNRFEG